MHAHPILSRRLKYQINASKIQTPSKKILSKIYHKTFFLVIKSLNTNKLLSVVWRYIYLVHPISKECANVYGYLQLKLSPKVGCNFWHSANTSQLKLHWKHVVTKYLSQIIWQFIKSEGDSCQVKCCHCPYRSQIWLPCYEWEKWIYWPSYNFGSEYICPRDPAGDGAGNGGSGGH